VIAIPAVIEKHRHVHVRNQHRNMPNTKLPPGYLTTYRPCSTTIQTLLLEIQPPSMGYIQSMLSKRKETSPPTAKSPIVMKTMRMSPKARYLLHRQNVDADHPSRVNWRTRPKPDRITVVPFIVARTPDRVEAGVVITSRGRLHLTCFIGIDLVLTMVICW